MLNQTRKQMQFKIGFELVFYMPKGMNAMQKQKSSMQKM